MKNASYYIDLLISSLIGLGDDENAFLQYQHLDTNDQSKMTQVFVETILPDFEKFGTLTKQQVKTTLRQLLSDGNTDFEEIFYSRLLPFEPPDIPRNFFLWLYKALPITEDETEK